MHRSLRLVAAALAAAAIAAPGAARAQNKVCVSSAYGVPGFDGTPLHWWEDNNGDGVVNADDYKIDDPHWTGASGQSTGQYGAAANVIDTRTAWTTEGGRDYLYVQWIVHVDSGLPGSNHLLDLLLMPPGVGIDSADSRLVEVRFQAGAAGAPVHCDDFNTCSDPAVFHVLQRDTTGGTPATAACHSIASGSGPSFLELSTAEPDGNPTWLTDTMRFRQDGDRWAVSVRIPVDPAATGIASAIREDTGIAYQVGISIGAGDTAVHRWPRSSDSDLVCEEGNAFGTTVVLDPAAVWPGLSLIGGGAVPDPAPGDCGHRLHLDSGDLGTRVGAPGTVLTHDYAMTGANTVVARVHNTSDTPIAAGSLQASFHIANWGSQIAVGGSWDPLPITGNAPPPPATSPQAIGSNAADIAVGSDQDVEVSWTLTPDQRCQYTYDEHVSPDPAVRASWDGQCVTCTLPAGYPPSTTGAQARSGSTSCLPQRTQHQCLQVELSGGDVDFESRSAYTNMDFANLSVFERKAVIDTAGLPTVPGQTKQHIYLVVMPRNMPDAVHAETFEQLIGENAVALLAALAEPEAPPTMHEDPHFVQLHPIGLIRPLPGNLELPQVGEELVNHYPRRLRPMAYELSRLALLRQQHAGVSSAQLVQALADSFDAGTLAKLVPTLDVYVYYERPKTKRLAPMTAFSLVTSHDGPVDGLRWALDDATHVGANVYELSIPVGKSHEVGVRVQAVEAGEKPITERPCGGCCRPSCESSIAEQVGNSPIPLSILFLAAGSLRRRRRKSPRA